MGFSLTRDITNCMGCGQKKECYTSKYDSPLCIDPDMRIEGLNNMGLFTMTCSLCDDCVGEPRKKFRRTARVKRHLDEIANKVFNEVRIKNNELEMQADIIADKDAESLTDEDKKLLSNKHKYDKRVQRTLEDLKEVKREHIKKVLKSDIIGVVVFAILGLLTYTGDGFIFFGLKYSWEEYMAVIAAYFAISVIHAIVWRKNADKIVREFTFTEKKTGVPASGLSASAK